MGFIVLLYWLQSLNIEKSHITLHYHNGTPLGGNDETEHQPPEEKLMNDNKTLTHPYPCHSSPTFCLVILSLMPPRLHSGLCNQTNTLTMSHDDYFLQSIIKMKITQQRLLGLLAMLAQEGRVVLYAWFAWPFSSAFLITNKLRHPHEQTHKAGKANDTPNISSVCNWCFCSRYCAPLGFWWLFDWRNISERDMNNII